MTKAVFERISAALQAAEYETVILPATEDTVVEQILVQLTPEEEDGDLLLQLLFVGDTPPQDAATDLSGEETDFLHFYVHLLDVQQTAVPDMARFLLHLNHLVPLPGFGMDEARRQTYFRYLLPAVGQQVDEVLVVEITDVISYILDTVGEALADLATGALSLEQATTAVAAGLLPEGAEQP